MSPSNPTTPEAPPYFTLLLPALLRTGVPMIYAMLINAGLDGLGLGGETVQYVLTVVLTVALYLVLRFAERWQSQIGWLLGYAQQPVYVPGAIVDTVAKAASDVDQGNVAPAAVIAAESPTQPVVEVDPPASADVPEIDDEGAGAGPGA